MVERTFTARLRLAESTFILPERDVRSRSSRVPSSRRGTSDAHGTPRPASLLAFVMHTASAVPRLASRRPKVEFAPTPYTPAATVAACRVPPEACLGRHRAGLRHARARGTPRLAFSTSTGPQAATRHSPAFTREQNLTRHRLPVPAVTHDRTSASIRRKEAVPVGIRADGVCILPPPPPKGGGPASRRVVASCHHRGRAPGTGPARDTSLRLLRAVGYHVTPQTPLVPASPRIWRPANSGYIEVMGCGWFRRPLRGLKQPPSASDPWAASRPMGAADQARPQWLGRGAGTPGHVRPGLLPGAHSDRIGLRPPASASILYGPGGPRRRVPSLRGFVVGPPCGGPPRVVASWTWRRSVIFCVLLPCCFSWEVPHAV